MQVVVDNAQEPLVLWYPETQELEVRVQRALDNAGYAPKDAESFERLKAKVHHRIKEAFDTDEINTLVQARVLMLDCLLKAAKRGDLINSETVEKRILDKQTLN